MRAAASCRQKFEGRREGKVACIGAGPASLACAAELAQQGFAVTVFERRPLPGGLNTYGVAEYKLPAWSSLREIELIEELGVEFRFGVEIDAEKLAGIEADFDLVFIGVGLGAGHGLKVPGGDHSGVMDALEFIAAYKTAKITQRDGQGGGDRRGQYGDRCGECCAAAGRGGGVDCVPAQAGEHVGV